MGLLNRFFGNKMSKVELLYEVGTKIFNEVHGKFTLKITHGIATRDADGNSEQEAYMEVTDMILSGDLSRTDLRSMCEAYMQIRENIIINRGGMPRWVHKELVGSRNNGDLRLISVVKKLDSGDDGLFARIQNDLGTYVEEAGDTEDALRLMAYGYARRVSGAGLYLQNIWGRDEYTHAFTMFKRLQSITQQRKNIESGTQQSIDFQNEAAKQAAELLRSYNPRLTFELIPYLLSAVEKREVPNLGVVLPDSFVLDLIENAVAKATNMSTARAHHRFK